MTDEPEHGAIEQANAPTPPVVFVPGIGHALSGWELLRRHLERAGFRHTSRFPASPGHVDVPHLADQLARHVDGLRALAGGRRAHLVAHNVGGIVARYFVQVLGGDDAVASVTTVGTPHAGTSAGQVGWGVATAQVRPGSAVLRRLEETARPMSTKWISYFAEHDLFVQPATSAVLRTPLLRATNLLVERTTHLSLAVPGPVCRSIAHQIAALERIPGYGSVVASSPLFVRLAGPEHGRLVRRPDPVRGPDPVRRPGPVRLGGVAAF